MLRRRYILYHFPLLTLPPPPLTHTKYLSLSSHYREQPLLHSFGQQRVTSKPTAPTIPLTSTSTSMLFHSLHDVQSFAQLESTQQELDQRRSIAQSSRNSYMSNATGSVSGGGGSTTVRARPHNRNKPSPLQQPDPSRDRGFDSINAVAGRLLSQLTSSARFHGDLNVDLNELCTNLVPFPKMPYLCAGLSPRRHHPQPGEIPQE